MLAQKINIAIVDDHDIVVKGIKSLLYGVANIFVVNEFKTGEAFLEHIQKEEINFQVVLLDLSLPGLDGDDILKQIADYHDTFKVVILTSYSELPMVKILMDLGALGFVLKVSSTEEIIEAIESACKGKMFLCKEIKALDKQKQVAKKEHILTPLEEKVVRLTCEGLGYSEIANLAGLTVNTVKSYRKSIYKKLDIHNKTDLLRFAIEHELFLLGIPFKEY